jgi:hypothetical protein
VPPRRHGNLTVRRPDLNGEGIHTSERDPANPFLYGWFVVQGVDGTGTNPRVTESPCWALPDSASGGARRPSRLPTGGQAAALHSFG